MDKCCSVPFFIGATCTGLFRHPIKPLNSLSLRNQRFPRIPSSKAGCIRKLGTGSKGLPLSYRGSCCRVNALPKRDACMQDDEHGALSHGVKLMAFFLGVTSALLVLGSVETSAAEELYGPVKAQNIALLGDFGRKKKKEEFPLLSKIFARPETAAQKAAEERAKLERERAAERTEEEKRKAAADARAKAQKEELAREQKAKIKLEQQAILGGSAVGLSYALMKGNLITRFLGSAFKAIGGPSLISYILRTPGYVIGRRVHVVEWNVSESPDYPDGTVETIRLHKHSVVGLKKAISKRYRLGGHKMVWQLNVWMTFGPGFYEPLEDFNILADPAWVVWSRKPKKGKDAIPLRADSHPSGKKASYRKSVKKQVSAIVNLVQIVAAASRNGAYEVEESPSIIESLDEDLRGFGGKDEGRSSAPKDKSGSGAVDCEDPHLAGMPGSRKAPRVGSSASREDALERVLDDSVPEGSEISNAESIDSDSLEHRSGLDEGFESEESAKRSHNVENEPKERAEVHKNLAVHRDDDTVGASKIAEGGNTGNAKRGGMDKGRGQKVLSKFGESDQESAVVFNGNSIQKQKGAVQDDSGGGAAGRIGGRGCVDSILEGISHADLPEDFQVISLTEENNLILMAARRDKTVLELFRVTALENDDVWSFLRLVRAHNEQSRQWL